MLGAELRGVTKSFPGAPPALDDLSLEVEQGELLVLVGPSGCGKSTALRIVAGLEVPDAGTVTLGGVPMAGVAPQDRDVAMVFQGYALYPQMTARQILEFPLAMRKVPEAERRRRVEETAALLRIEPLLGRRPGEMSGGERQRVAMGRAMVRKPKVFLFDEPLSNLDPSLRADLRLEIAQLVRRVGATALYVTHDQTEAMTLGDRLAVMQRGRILQIGTPQEVYERPATAFVASFVGSPRMNLVPAGVDGQGLVFGPIRVALPPSLRGPDVGPGQYLLGVRPHDLCVTGAEGTPAELVAVEPCGAETHVVVRVEGETMRGVASGFGPGRRGDTVPVSVDPSKVLVFEARGEGKRIAG